MADLFWRFDQTMKFKHGTLLKLDTSRDSLLNLYEVYGRSTGRLIQSYTHVAIFIALKSEPICPVGFTRVLAGDGFIGIVNDDYVSVIPE